MSDEDGPGADRLNGDGLRGDGLNGDGLRGDGLRRDGLRGDVPSGDGPSGDPRDLAGREVGGGEGVRGQVVGGSGEGAEEAGRVRVAVVIVTHDTRDEVLGCLATLPVAGADEVVVVDNGSEDGTAATVRRLHPQVRLLELANAGFGRGANAGMRATSASVVVVCNADVRFEPGSVARLAELLDADAQLAAAGPAVVYPDGSPQASARTDPDLTTAIGHAVLGRIVPDNRWTRRYRQLEADPGTPRTADWLSGCALALRRDAVASIGGFDPGYFLYLEDVDLGARLRAAGWRLRYEPSARVVHRVGASTRANRWRALVNHAASLDRYHARRYGSSPVGALSRPPLRVALATWVCVTWCVERLVGRARSTTGERLRVR